MSEYVIPPSDEIVDPITSLECSSLGNNTGLDLSDGETTCQALQQRLLPLIAQIVGDISTGVMTIYANDDSKCDENDDPTLASMMSRIYRVSQAFACILCQYDPTLSNMLMSGTYPQVLMGKQTQEGYPGWVTPDSTPTLNSQNLVTSGGIYTAIQNAIMSVWHLWKGDGTKSPTNGEFAYALINGEPVSDLPTTGNTNGDWALRTTLPNSGGVSSVYTYQWDGGTWRQKGNFPSYNMVDFSVIHVKKGEFEDKGLYWFHTGWNLLDADLTEIEQRMDALEQQYESSIIAIDTNTVYKVGVVDTVAEARAILAETGTTKIIFIKNES